MKVRPWPLVILAFIHFLAPLANILASAALMKVNLATYFHLLFHQETPLQLAHFFLALPLAGVAIYAVKEWSYPVFLLAVASTFYTNFHAWYEHPRTVTLPLLGFVYAINFGIVSYFLLPAVRAAYFNRKLRWWESQPRYKVSWKVEVDQGSSLRKGKILDISEGGVFIATSSDLDRDSTVRLRFQCGVGSVSTAAKVVYRMTSPKGKVRGYGMQFDLTGDTKSTVREVIQDLRTRGVETRFKTGNWGEELTSWAKQLVKTGRGWVPELPQTQPARGKSAKVISLASRRRNSRKRSRGADSGVSKAA